MVVRGRFFVALYAGVLGTCQAYPSQTWPIERLAQAPVLATCVVLQTTHDSTLIVGERTVLAHATLRVLRAFPPAALREGERIRLDFEALPDESLRMSGPDVPPLKPGTVFVLPLKLNSRPASDAWRLIADHGQGLAIPATLRNPRFSARPRDGLEFAAREIASVLSSGTRAEVLAEATYVSAQKAIAPAVVRLLETRVSSGDDRWALIAASLLSSMGTPRSTIADFRASKDGPLITAVLQRLGESERANAALIHQLLAYSDIASWGAGLTLREFAQEPSLVRELHSMLESRSAGSLSIARDVLNAGPNQILGDATALALYYIATPGMKPSEVRTACSVIRDFGSDQQFGELIGAIKKSQYQDPRRYEQLWAATIWSDNPRERRVLEILVADQRVYQAGQRYSDIAKGELARIH